MNQYYARLVPDFGLSPEALENKYNPNGGGEHPVFTREDWRRVVNQFGIISGYWTWVMLQLDKMQDHADGMP